MPYVHIHMAQKLSDDQRETLKARVGQLIEILPGKSEQVLMLRFDDAQQMYYRGVPENCVYVNICLYLMSPDEKKEEFAHGLAAALTEIAGIDPSNMFISFSEYNNWFSHGRFK